MASPAERDAQERIEAATAVLREFRESIDGAVPQAVARSARCVAILPGLVHAGLLLGARAGRGLLTCRTSKGWSQPAFIVLNGASAGIQAGVQKTDLLMLAMTNAGEEALVRGKLQLGPGTTIAAGPVGRGAELSGDITLAAILYYARAQGLYVGVDLSGTVIEQDEASSRAFYGDARDFGVLLRGPREVPPLATRFEVEVARTFGR
ncbi:MAG: hypothetical protein K0S65_4049 [Labilithrix sp.]|nr:hypothetical protein [Labilithrix sp.]